MVKERHIAYWKTGKDIINGPETLRNLWIIKSIWERRKQDEIISTEELSHKVQIDATARAINSSQENSRWVKHFKQTKPDKPWEITRQLIKGPEPNYLASDASTQKSVE